MAENIGGGRPIRFCPGCQQADDHPRHAVVGEDPNVAWHLDCCRDIRGCPDGTCDVIAEGAPGPGQQMLDHILRLHEQEDVPALVAELREDIPTKDPRHPSFVGFDVPGLVPTTLQSADR